MQLDSIQVFSLNGFTYIYENYGIYTMLNHSFGRYGLTINGSWVPVTDYRDDATQEILMSEVTELAEDL